MQPFWTISETCVWAATLDLDAVAVVHGDRPDSVHWLFADSPPIDYGNHVMAWRRSGGAPDIWEAFTQLRALCGDGRLTMLGVPRGDGNIESIPEPAWAALEILPEVAVGFVARIPLNSGACWWTQLRLRRP
jgi:hypothetical protein